MMNLDYKGILGPKAIFGVSDKYWCLKPKMSVESSIFLSSILQSLMLRDPCVEQRLVNRMEPL